MLLTPNDEILAERRGGLVVVTLNRAKALNALSPVMCCVLDAELPGWAADPAVRAVLIRGAGGRAFCAGGDVRAIVEARKTGEAMAFGSAFFRDEYRLNRHIARFAKPWISLLDGITMGGGAGISVHGSHRIATEKLLFAMPETAIGLFPDIGANAFFNRCPGRIGLYLALAGARIGAADALYAGLATHFVPSERLGALTERIAALNWADGGAGALVDRAIAEFTAEPGPAPLAALRPAIDRCFGQATVAAILDSLAGEPSDWARATLETLTKASPTSLAITRRQLALGEGLSIEEVLRLDYRIALRCLDRPDFFEGVRALLIDKDATPLWQPPRLAEVTEATIDGYFQPLGADELTFP
ncbi:MAG: enoyl-CoA hydratase [Rhodospirillales bacterium]|nr:enoyl-CoA hydratase [Rhodospirillales bacterium]